MSRPDNSEWEDWAIEEVEIAASRVPRPKPVRGKHWGVYDRGTELDRYRYCYACLSWRRNPMLRDSKPLIKNGGKP